MRIACRVEVRLADMWIGLFWKRTNCRTSDGNKPFATDFWICVVPCLPIHVTVWHKVLINMTADALAKEGE